MWHGVGVIAGLLSIALVVWQAIRLANINIEIGVTPSMITAALALLLLVFVIIRFLDQAGPWIATTASPDVLGLDRPGARDRDRRSGPG